MKFYKCETCGNIIQFEKNVGVPVMCCGKKMTEMIPGTSDGAAEKHVPVIRQEESKVVVEVGSVTHPMVEEHYIEWIALQTEKGMQKRTLLPGEAPRAEFILTEDDKVVVAYEYCNIHGLWKS